MHVFLETFGQRSLGKGYYSMYCTLSWALKGIITAIIRTIKSCVGLCMCVCVLFL